MDVVLSLRAASVAASVFFPDAEMEKTAACLASEGLTTSVSLFHAFSTPAAQKDIAPFLLASGIAPEMSMVLITAAKAADPAFGPRPLKRLRSPSPRRNSSGVFVPLPPAPGPAPSSSNGSLGRAVPARSRVVAASHAVAALFADGTFPEASLVPVIKASRAPPTLSAEIAAGRAAASKRVLSVLRVLGTTSPRWAEVFGVKGGAKPVSGAAGTFAALAMGRRNTAVTLNYCAEVCAFLLWLRAAGRDLGSVTELVVGSYIRLPAAVEGPCPTGCGPPSCGRSVRSDSSCTPGSPIWWASSEPSAATARALGRFRLSSCRLTRSSR